MENIDDELDEAGIIFVTTEDTIMAKKLNIKLFPQLVFFRNRDPLFYKGDLEDEDEVLSWLTDENTLEIPGKIEEVNSKMLEKILAENDHVVVFFCKLFYLIALDAIVISFLFYFSLVELFKQI